MEGNLLLVTVSKVALGKSVKEENIRANIVHGVLERLSYEL
ncbi:MAG: hypothetical protein L0J35_03885 [Tetragenococcus halophilus]|nr:hypothetical protein [Tetragenococcus halophilus]